MSLGIDREELLLRMGSLRRELSEVEHLLHLVPDGGGALPPAAGAALPALVAEYALDLISVHSASGDYLYATANARQLFGWNPEELVGHSAYEFFHPEDLQLLAGEHAALTAGHATEVRYRFRTALGDYRWVETRARPTEDTRYLVAVTRDVQREQELIERLERSSSSDVLTGLLNRRGIQDALDREMERARRDGSELAVLFFDVDRFKAINDERGHDAGDEVLQRVGSIIAARKRMSDEAGRWGGDEFLVLLPVTTAVEAARLGRRISKGISESLPGVSLSIGISSTHSATTGRDLLRQADDMLYAVKRRGGDGISVFGCLLPPRPGRAPRASEPERSAP